jgi:hypothetical protein
MIDITLARRLVQNLSGLSFFPRVEEGEQQLVLALRNAHSEIIAAKVITDWIAERRECPTPADLYRLLNDEKERALPPLECAQCHGNGLYGGHMNGVYGRWKWCTCEAGERLLRAEPDAVDRMNEANERVQKTQSAGGAS